MAEGARKERGRGDGVRWGSLLRTQAAAYSRDLLGHRQGAQGE